MQHTLTGNIQYHRDFRARFLRDNRDVIVYLPPGYETELDSRYPVIYMQDGQNLFDAATAFAGNEWGLDEIAEDLISNGLIQPLIVVGVYNAGTKRLGEYTHVSDGRGHGGRARNYTRSIVKDLKPMIDTTYRTLPDCANTGMGGSSLGGLVSLYAGLAYPEVFGRLIVMSPSVWWANRDIIRQVRKYGHTPGQKIWLDMGTCEGAKPEDCLRDARDLRDALLRSGWQMHRDIEFMEDEGAAHHEAAWGRRMRDALQFLFPPTA